LKAASFYQFSEGLVLMANGTVSEDPVTITGLNTQSSYSKEAVILPCRGYYFQKGRAPRQQWRAGSILTP